MAAKVVSHAMSQRGAIVVQSKSVFNQLPDGGDIEVQIERTEIRFEIVKPSLEQLRIAPPPREYIVNPILPTGSVAELAGAHGISKSTLALHMVLSVAAKYDFGGLPTATGPVFFISREDALDELLRRTHAWLDDLDPDERLRCEVAFIERLHLIGREQCTGLKLTEKAYGACQLHHTALKLIIERCQGAKLIVLETASRLSGGDELNEDLAQLAEALELIAAGTGAAVLLVRHVAKSAARERVVDSYAGRGGGALSDACRSVLVLTELDAETAQQHGITLRDRGRAVMLVHAKASYSMPAEPLFFERLPGPLLAPLIGKSRDDMHDAWLAAYLAERTAGGAVSTRQIVGDCQEHRVPARCVKATLHRLATKKLVQAISVTGRGGARTAWTSATSATLF